MSASALNCFAIAAPGLEPLVARELAALGEHPRIEDGGVTWEGDVRSVLRANLWLRTASRVLVRVARFEAKAFYELERHAKRIPWDEWARPGDAVEFKVTARKSKLYHSDAIAQRLESALGSRLEAQSPKPKAQSREPNAPGSQLFIVRAVRDEFVISADTSGELLHQRGYRQAIAKAPLRETLGAALLLAAGYDGSVPLLDPFCGSGTIPIEAALIARRMAPGLRREFAVERWPAFYPPIAAALREDARSRQLRAAPAAILGSDRDAGAIEAASANAARAGVEADITFSRRAVSAVEDLTPGTLVATNPPYGVRVGKGSDVRDLYAQFGNVMRARGVGANVAMYLPDGHLGKQTRLAFEELYKTSNGGLPVAAVLASVR